MVPEIVKPKKSPKQIAVEGGKKVYAWWKSKANNAKLLAAAAVAAGAIVASAVAVNSAGNANEANSAQNARIAAVESSLADVDARVDDIATEAATQKNDIDALADRQDEISDILDQVAAQMDELARTNALNDEAVQRLSEQLNALAAAIRPASPNLAPQIEALAGLLANVDAENDVQVAQALDGVAQVSDSVATLANELRSVDGIQAADITALKKQAEDLKAQAAAAQAVADKAQADADAVSVSAAAARTAADAAAVSAVNAQAAVDTLRAEYEAAIAANDTRVTDIEARLAVAEANATQANTAATAAQTTADGLAADVEEALILSRSTRQFAGVISSQATNADNNATLAQQCITNVIAAIRAGTAVQDCPI